MKGGETMRQGTTPTYILTIPGHDLTDQTVFVTVSGRGKRITKTGDALTIAYSDNASTIAFRLTQEETFALQLGVAQVQVRFIDAAGTALATDIGTLNVEQVLQPGVIAYEGGA